MKARLTDVEALALDVLYDGIRQAEDNGLLVPCLGHAAWTVDGDQARAEYAAARCRLCPAFDACRRAAEATQPTAGVWAGIDYERRALDANNARTRRSRAA